MARLPVHAVSMPAVLDGATNGKLSTKTLRTVSGAPGGAGVTLAVPAARAWRALEAAAKAAGHVLKIGWSNSAYRPYYDQERIFRERYYTVRIWRPGARRWQGRWWAKRSGVAAAAVPGTSNHGWGLAVDIGEERDGDAATEPISNAAVDWLIANADRFGWSAEIQTERWHWRYFAGDRIPDAVIAFETPPPTIFDNEEDDMLPKPVHDPNTRTAMLIWMQTDADGRLKPHFDVYGTYRPVGEAIDGIGWIAVDQEKKNNWIKVG